MELIVFIMETVQEINMCSFWDDNNVGDFKNMEIV